jgi:hypothetical protein
MIPSSESIQTQLTA